MRIYIIRHGETIKNNLKSNDIFKKNNITYDKDSELTENGYRQCNNVANYLYSKDHNDIKIYTSPLKRTIQSSNYIKKILNSHNNIIIDKRLYGSNNKNIEVNIITEIKELLNEIYMDNPESTILIVTHNHIINSIYKIIEGYNISKKKFSNASISIIDMIKPFIFKDSDKDFLINHECNYINHLIEDYNM